MDLIKLYEADRMEEGKKIELLGNKERKEFLSIYPTESIPNLTIEQYVIGNDNSFSHWLCYKLRHVASMGGNTYPNAFGVYTKKTGSQILLSSSYKKDFGSDYEKAFNSLKNDIANFLEDIKQENYDNYEKYRRIDRRVRDMLMVVYFCDRFVPVCTKDKIEGCLKSVGERFEEKTPMVYKNLALVEWKKTVPELADWSNQMVLDFCLWLSAKNIITNKEELDNNIVIEKAKEIEEEISSLNVDGASQKAIVNVRVNQDIFRNYLLKRYKRCRLCGVENPTLLIASHIKPWAESEAKEKLDVDNGFLMCPNHDKIFDKGYITFDDDGKIIISEKLAEKENDMVFLNVDSRMHIELTEGNKKYLKFHRENIFNS
ncbi:MAG: hypothetical protein HFG92_12265 [Dorea sp.]|jgi:hypothetical protein|nr:hypothetical protein [Dorea sp.]